MLIGWLFLNLAWTSGSKETFVEYVEHFLPFLEGIVIFKIAFLDFAKFSQTAAFYFFMAQVTRVTSFSYLRGCLCLYVNFILGLNLSRDEPSLSRVKCLLLFTRFRRDKLIPVKNL